MKKSLLSLLCLSFTVAGFAACENIPGIGTGSDSKDSTPAHVHTYADTWSNDAEGHWYEYTCECEDVEVTKIEHVDNNNDGACDICTYAECEHTYSEDWTLDCTNHWHAADCGHIVAGVDLAEHADENEDGKCDECGYVIEDIHVHIYDDEWTFDENDHWHAAVCEHADEVADKAAHVINAAGDCTVCGAKVAEVDVTNIEDVLAAATDNQYKVIDGAVIANQVVFGGSGSNMYVENGAMNKVYFVLGNGESYINYRSYDMNGEFLSVEEQWHQALGNDEYFGVVLRDEADNNPLHELAPMASDAQFLKGYTYFPGSILNSTSDDTSTLETTLAGLYAKMKAGVNVSNAVEGYDEETGYYGFAYTYYSVNVATVSGELYSVELELYNVAVSFTVNADMIIDKADFYVEVYRDYENDSDLAYTYTDNGDGTITITSDVTLKDTANPSYYTYSVAQHAGVRTFTSPYPRTSLIPQDFELAYVTQTDWADDGNLMILDEEPVGDTLTLAVDEYVRLHLGDALPITASFNFINEEDFEFSFVNKTSGATGILWKDAEFLRPSYSAFSDCITFKVADAGTYDFTIRFGTASKTITIIVPEQAAPEVDEDDENTIHVATTDTYAWGVDEYSYTATAAGTYTFTLPAGLGFQTKASWDSYGAPEMDFYDNANGATVRLELAAGETVGFYVAAITKGNWVITVAYGDVGGGDVGGDEDEGDYDYETVIVAGGNTLYFSSAEVSANSATRSCVITAAGDYTFASGNLFIASVVDANGAAITKNSDYSYTLAEGEYTINFGMLSMFGVAANTPCTLNLEGGNVGGGDEEVPTQEPIYLTDGENVITVTEADIQNGTVIGEYFVMQAGNYSIYSSWLDAIVKTEDGTVVEADDYGVVTLEGWTNYIVEIDLSWLYGAGEYELYIEYQAPLGHQDNPIGIEEGTYTASYNGDSAPIWHSYYAMANGTLTVSSENASMSGLMICAAYGYEVANEEGNSVSLDVIAGMTYYIGVANFDAVVPVEIAFTVAFVEGEIVRDGSKNIPYAIVEGEQTAAVPEWSYVYYMYRATADCVLTLSSADENCAWFVMETLNAWGTETNEDLIVELWEGQIVYFAVGAADCTETQIVFTASVKDAPTAAYVELTLNGVANALTIADNTYAVAEVYGMGNYIVTWDDENVRVFVDYVEIENGGTFNTPNPRWPVTIEVYANGYVAVNVNVTIAPYVVPALELALGANTVSVEDSYNGTNVAFTATVAGTYTFTAGTNTVLGYEYSNYLEGESFSVTLEADQKVEFVVLTGNYEPGDVVVTVSDGSDSGEVTPPAGPDGTRNNPYVATELPYSITVAAGRDFYITYTATADCTLQISYPAGCYISEAPSNFIKDATACTWTGTVTAGQVLLINPWGGAGDECTYTISVVETTTGGDVEGGDNDNTGDDTATGVTYLSERHSNGRYLKVIINASAGTMTLIRSNMSGGWDAQTATAEYSYAFDGTTVTATCISGQTCTITWNADGTPASITWASAVYINFTVQA